MKTAWGIFLGLIIGLVAMAAASDSCFVCGKKPLTGKVWTFREQLICDECAQIKERCSLCHFPAKAPYYSTSDGRFICRRCEPTTILKLEQAQALWNELVTQIDTMSQGQLVLKQKNVSLSLYDIDYWNSQNGKAVPQDMRRAGLSQSRPTSQGLAHAVLLFSGLSRDETRSVLAHEFTHLWINENTTAGRKIDPRTVEGLCELVAYALNRELNIPAQNEFILKNTYTRGRINELVEMEKQYSFKSIMGWVVDSKDEDIAEASLGRPNPKSKDTGPGGVPLYAIRPAEKVRDLNLVLRGITGTGKNRLALINDRTFVTGEKGTIRLANSSLKITCQQILEKSVVVQVEGEGSPRTILLGE